MRFNSALTRRPTSAARRCLSSLHFVYLPCLKLASEMRCSPSGVLAPLDRPPCKLQRPLCLCAGLWHSVPRRVLAPHLSPCHLGPNRVSRPNSEICFVTVMKPPIMGCLIITFLRSSFERCNLVKNQLTIRAVPSV